MYLCMRSFFTRLFRKKGLFGPELLDKLVVIGFGNIFVAKALRRREHDSVLSVNDAVNADESEVCGAFCVMASCGDIVAVVYTVASVIQELIRISRVDRVNVAFDSGVAIRNHSANLAVVDFNFSCGCSENIVAEIFRIVSCRDACRSGHSYGELRDSLRCRKICGLVGFPCRNGAVLDVANISNIFANRRVVVDACFCSEAGFL